MPPPLPCSRGERVSAGLLASASHLTTDKETTPPPISGLSGTQGSCHRPSLDQVENIGRLTPSQETVVPEFLGYVEFPRFSGIVAGGMFAVRLAVCLSSPLHVRRKLPITQRRRCNTATPC